MVARRSVGDIRTLYTEELKRLLREAIEAYETEYRRRKELGRELIREYREANPEQYRMVDGVRVRAGDQILPNPCSREGKRKQYRRKGR